ncbi:hypothetical protein IZY60_13635 [Lutibacter sp. B2]|nr:hypothetical protein [Lutibacter sp. B2]
MSYKLMDIRNEMWEIWKFARTQEGYPYDNMSDEELAKSLFQIFRKYSNKYQSTSWKLTLPMSNETDIILRQIDLNNSSKISSAVRFLKRALCSDNIINDMPRRDIFGPKVDIAHVIATAEGYFTKENDDMISPMFYGWGGDLASLVRPVEEMVRNEHVSYEKAAEHYVFEKGNFSNEDLYADAYGALFGIEVKKQRTLKCKYFMKSFDDAFDQEKETWFFEDFLRIVEREDLGFKLRGRESDISKMVEKVTPIYKMLVKTPFDADDALTALCKVFIQKVRELADM